MFNNGDRGNSTITPPLLSWVFMEQIPRRNKCPSSGGDKNLMHNDAITLSGSLNESNLGMRRDPTIKALWSSEIPLANTKLPGSTLSQNIATASVLRTPS